MAPCLLAFSLSLLGVLPAPNLQFAPGDRADRGDGADRAYEAALAAVEEANIAANRDPESNLPILDSAIEQLASFGPQLAVSADGREALELSRLNLARTLLLIDNEDRAAEIMDQVLRESYGRKLPIKRFGPTLVNFHDQRRALLEAQGTAAIQVHCRVSCRVVIDAQAATTDSGPLYLGSHRVWIEATEDESAFEPARHEVVLDQSGATTVVYFPEQETDCAEPAPAVLVEPRPVEGSSTTSSPRILPRWAEIAVLAIGIGAAVAGGVMLGLDGSCPGGLDLVADAQQCPQIYEGTVPGLVAVGVGSALLLAGTVTLSVDEVRVGNQRGRQATLGWRMRF